MPVDFSGIGGAPADRFNETTPSPNPAQDYSAPIAAQPWDESRPDPLAGMDNLLPKVRPGDYVTLPNGSRLSREDLYKYDGGKELVRLQELNARGPRGFGEAVTDFNSGDLPFVGDVTGVVIPIRELRRVADTFKKMENGDKVSDQELVYAQLFLTDQERRSQASTGGMVGEVLRAMPGFAAEIGAYTLAGAYIAAHSPAPPATAVVGGVTGAVVGTGKAAVKVGTKVASKFLREGAEEAAERWSKKLITRVAGYKTLRKGGRAMVGGALAGTGIAAADTAVNAAYNIATGEDPLMSRQAGERYVGAQLAGDDMSMREAQMMALGDRWIEYVSEKSGEGIGTLLMPGKGSTKWITDTLDKNFPKAAGAIREKAAVYTGIKLLASKMSADGDPKTMFKWLKNVGYDGYVEEMLEERFGGLARGLFGIEGDEDENRVKNALRLAIPDRQQFAVEAISFAVPIATVLAAAKVHRIAAGQDTPEMKKHLRNVLLGTSEMAAPHVERVGDELFYSGGKTGTGVTLEDTVNSIKELDKINRQRPKGAVGRILDAVTSLGETLITGNFMAFSRQSDMGQVLSRYGREDLAAKYGQIRSIVAENAQYVDAYKGLSQEALDEKIDAVTKEYMTEVVGVARKSLVLSETALDKAVASLGAEDVEAAKNELTAHLRERLGGEAPRLKVLPIGSGRNYHELFVRTEDGHPISEEIMRINKAANEVLDRHGINLERKIVTSAHDISVEELQGVEVSLDELDALALDPFSIKSSVLAGVVDINPGFEGGPARFAKLLSRHKALLAGGVHGIMFDRYGENDKGQIVLVSRVGYEELPDGGLYFRPKYSNSGTDAERKARLVASENDAAALNAQIDRKSDPHIAADAAVAMGFKQDTTPPSIKFSKNVLMATKNPRILASIYGFESPDDAKVEQYIREQLSAIKTKDGYWGIGAGNLNDDNQVAVKASANLWHTWEELSEHALRLWNIANGRGGFGFESQITDFVDAVRDLAAEQIKSGSKEKVPMWRALVAMLEQRTEKGARTTDAPVKLFGQLFLGYNETEDLVGEPVAFSEQIELLRPEIMAAKETPAFAQYMGYVTKILKEGGSLNQAQFDMQVNPYLSDFRQRELAAQLVSTAKTKAEAKAEAPKAEAKAPAKPAAPAKEAAKPAPKAPAEKQPVADKAPESKPPALMTPNEHSLFVINREISDGNTKLKRANDRGLVKPDGNGGVRAPGTLELGAVSATRNTISDAVAKGEPINAELLETYNANNTDHPANTPNYVREGDVYVLKAPQANKSAAPAASPKRPKLYRGTTRTQWEALQRGEQPQSEFTTGGNTWATTSLESARGYTRATGKDAVIIEYKDSAHDKVSTLTDDPGDKRRQGPLVLEDVQRVTDGEGTVIYEAPAEKQSAAVKPEKAPVKQPVVNKPAEALPPAMPEPIQRKASATKVEAAPVVEAVAAPRVARMGWASVLQRITGEMQTSLNKTKILPPDLVDQLEALFTFLEGAQFAASGTPQQSEYSEMQNSELFRDALSLAEQVHEKLLALGGKSKDKLMEDIRSFAKAPVVKAAPVAQKEAVAPESKAQEPTPGELNYGKVFGLPKEKIEGEERTSKTAAAEKPSRRKNIQFGAPPTKSVDPLTKTYAEQTPAFKPAVGIPPERSELSPDAYFSNGKVIEPQRDFIASMSKAAIARMARVVGANAEISMPDDVAQHTLDKPVVDDPVSNAEQGQMESGDERTLKQLKKVSDLAESMQLVTGLDGYQSLYELTHEPEVLARLTEAASSDDAFVAWVERSDAGEKPSETALKAMIRVMNKLAVETGGDEAPGYTSQHLADMVETMRIMVQQPAGEVRISADGRHSFEVLNRTNPEAQLRELALNRLNTFQIDIAKEGNQLAAEYKAIMSLPGVETRSMGNPNPGLIANLLKDDKSKFKTELFKFLHKFTGAPLAYFETASRSAEGRKAIGDMVGTNLEYWFYGYGKTGKNREAIGGARFNDLLASKNVTTAQNLLGIALEESWLGVNKFAQQGGDTDKTQGSSGKSYASAVPNMQKIMKLANVSEGTYAPTYRDSTLKGQAGWTQMDKYTRFAADFFKAIGSTDTIDNGGIRLLKSVVTPDGRTVYFGDMNVFEMRAVIQKQFEEGYLYTGVYGDKVNNRFIKVPNISVADAAATYRKLYEAPTNTLLDQAVWISPEAVDQMVKEHDELGAKIKTGNMSKADSAKMNSIAHEIKRIRFITEFDRIVDGDARFYAPKLRKGTTMPDFLLKTVAENGGSLTAEQRSMDIVDRIAGDLLDARTKRRGNDLTGGRDLSSLERHLKDIANELNPGKPRANGMPRVLVIKNALLGISTDGMALYRAATFGAGFVRSQGEDFAGNPEAASTVKFQISSTKDIKGARIPVLDKLNSVAIEQLSADPDRTDAMLLQKFMEAMDIDIIIFDSSEKVPSGYAYTAGFLPDDRLAIDSLDDLSRPETLAKVQGLVRSVSGSDFIVPLALHGPTEPSDTRFAKQLQQLMVASPNGESYRQLIDEYITAVAANVKAGDYQYLTDIAIKQLGTGDSESKRLAAALKSGNLSIVSPAIRSRVNLMQAVLKSMQFTQARVRGPLVMRFDKKDSGRMDRPGDKGPYKLVNANIDSPFVNYVVNLKATDEDTARAQFAKMFDARYRKRNPREFESVTDDMPANSDIVRVPFIHAFEVVRETRPAANNELASSVVDGVRMIDAGAPHVVFNADRTVNADVLRKNVIYKGADGVFRLHGSLTLGDRIPADGSQSMRAAFLHHGFPDAAINLIEQDADFVANAGVDGDGDSPNLWLQGDMIDQSPNGIKNRFLGLVMDDYLTNPVVQEWANRSIEKLNSDIIVPMGEEMKHGPDAPIKPVTYSNTRARLEYDWKIGQVGKGTVGTAAKANTTTRRLASVGAYLYENFGLKIPGHEFTFSHTAKDAADILNTSDFTMWNRFQMALHVSMQMGVSRAVDDAKAFIQGHMQLWNWRLAIELTGTAFNKSILHPKGEFDAAGKLVPFNYDAEFPAAAEESKAMTRAVAKSKFLDAVDNILNSGTKRLDNDYKPARVRQSMLAVADRFLTEEERNGLSLATRGLQGRKLDKARDGFITYSTNIGSWIRLHDLAESIRVFGAVSDIMVVDNNVQTVENISRANEAYTSAINGVAGDFTLLHPERVAVGATVMEKLNEALPFAHLSETKTGRAVNEALTDGGKKRANAVAGTKIDTALGTLQAQTALRNLIDQNGGLETLDPVFPIARVLKLREAHPDFFNLLAPSGMFEGSLELIPVYSGPRGLPLPEALATKARAEFDKMPRQLQLEVAVAALSAYDVQTGPKHHSFTMLMGDPETSQFVRDFTEQSVAVFNTMKDTMDDKLFTMALGMVRAKNSYEPRFNAAKQILNVSYVQKVKFRNGESESDMNPGEMGVYQPTEKEESAAEDVVAEAPVAEVATPAVKAVVKDLVTKAKPPAMFAPKELAKAATADAVLAPTLGDYLSYAVRLGSEAKEAGVLADDTTSNSRVYVSLPGKGRKEADRALADVVAALPGLLARGNTLLTDNEANAMREHNLPGEGALRKALQDLGAVETSFGTHSEWTQAPVAEAPQAYVSSEWELRMPARDARDLPETFTSQAADGSGVRVSKEDDGSWTVTALDLQNPQTVDAAAAVDLYNKVIPAEETEAPRYTAHSLSSLPTEFKSTGKNGKEVTVTLDPDPMVGWLASSDGVMTLIPDSVALAYWNRTASGEAPEASAPATPSITALLVKSSDEEIDVVARSIERAKKIRVRPPELAIPDTVLEFWSADHSEMYSKRADGSWEMAWPVSGPNDTTEIIAPELANQIYQDSLASQADFADVAEAIETWKQEEGIRYRPEEAWARGEAFYHDIGAFNSSAPGLLAEIPRVLKEQNKLLKQGGVKWWGETKNQLLVSGYTDRAPKRTPAGEITEIPVNSFAFGGEYSEEENMTFPGEEYNRRPDGTWEVSDELTSGSIEITLAQALKAYKRFEAQEAKTSHRPGSGMRFVVMPTDQDIVWAAAHDVYSGTVASYLGPDPEVSKAYNAYTGIIQPSTFKYAGNTFEARPVPQIRSLEQLRAQLLSDYPSLSEEEATKLAAGQRSRMATEAEFRTKPPQGESLLDFLKNGSPISRIEFKDAVELASASALRTRVDPKAPSAQNLRTVSDSIAAAIEGRTHYNELGLRLRLGNFYIEGEVPQELEQLNRLLKNAYQFHQGTLAPIPEMRDGRAPATPSIDKLTGPDLNNKLIQGMAFRNHMPSEPWKVAKLRLQESPLMTHLEKITAATTRAEAYKLIDNPPSGYKKTFDKWAALAYRDWVDANIKDVAPGTPSESFAQVPDWHDHYERKTLVDEWVRKVASDLVGEEDEDKLRNVLSELAPAWETALGGYMAAANFEEARDALARIDVSLWGITNRARESMRHWAMANMPWTFAKEMHDYHNTGSDVSPYTRTLDPLAVDELPEDYGSGRATYSVSAVVNKLEDALSPYRGAGASKLTKILVDEADAVDAALGKINRFYEKGAVEWGLTGRINKYVEHTYKIDPTGRNRPYVMTGRALFDGRNADTLNDEEKKLNALIQHMAWMGLEHTKKEDGKRVFDNAHRKDVHIILPALFDSDLETLELMLPKALAKKLFDQVQEARKTLPMFDAEDTPAIAAEKSRVIATALKKAAGFDYQKVPIRPGDSLFNAENPENNWKATKISYAVSLADLEAEMQASSKGEGDNQLIAKLIKNKREASRLTVETLVNETAEKLEELSRFANSRVPWSMSNDAIFMRYRNQYATHYFGTGFYGPNERAVRMLLDKAIAHAAAEQEAMYLKVLGHSKGSDGSVKPLSAVSDKMLEILFSLKGLEYKSRDDALNLIASGTASDLGLNPDMTYADVATEIHNELMEALQERAAANADINAKLHGIDDPAALAKALRTVQTAFKDREATNRSKARTHDTFEKAFNRSGRRPRNMGALDALHKYSSDVLLALRNRVIMNQLVQVTDAEGTVLVVPEPNLQSTLKDSEQLLTGEAWDIVAERLARWFKDAVDPATSARENVERMIQKHIVRNKSYVRVESPYESVPAFYAFRRDLGRENVMDALLSKGEVAGILQHVFGKPWQDPWGILKGLEHLNQWMKIQALQLSLFFPIAGQEGLAAVFGHKFLAAEGGPIMSQVEWRRMIKAGHPYAMKMIEEAEAIGIKFSSAANPMGLPAGMIERDIEKVTDFVETNIGKRPADGIKAMMGFSKKQTNFMFESYYNTVKIWTVQKFAEGLREKALAEGREFDFATEMLPYVDYINAEVGGVNWNKYSWMTPTWKRNFSLLMFSPDWGISAWNAAGGGILTGPVMKNFMTDDEYNFIFTRRWPQMMLYVMLLAPMLVQAVAYAVGMAAGTVGDDDEWLIFNNEEGRKLHADLTPMLRAMPWYGGAPTGQRRSYIRWGKQAYETQRWLESPWNSLMGKSSQMARWAIEQATGTSGGSMNYPLPFKDQGLLGLIRGKDGDFMGSRLGYTVQKFLPFSILAWAQNPDAAPVQVLGPVSKGMSFYTATQAYTGLLDSWARDVTYSNVYKNPRIKANLEALGQDILDSVERNGYDPKAVITAAKGAVLKDFYAGLYRAINANDQVAVEKWSRCIIRLNGTVQSTLSSVKNRNELYGKPEKLTEDQRKMVREAFDRP